MDYVWWLAEQFVILAPVKVWFFHFPNELDLKIHHNQIGKEG